MHLIQTHPILHYCYRVGRHSPQWEELIHKSVVFYAHKALSACLHFNTLASSHSPPSCRRVYSPFTQLTFTFFLPVILVLIFFFSIIWLIVFPRLLSEVNLLRKLEHLFTCVTSVRGQQVQGLYDRLHYKYFEHRLEVLFVYQHIKCAHSEGHGVMAFRLTQIHGNSKAVMDIHWL